LPWSADGRCEHDRHLDKARRRGTVLAGLSAGAICWFRAGNSDSRKFSNPANNTLIRVRGLNFVDAMLCPHYDSEAHRQPALRQMMRTTSGVAIALEDNAAIEIIDQRYRILASQRGQSAYRVFWQHGRPVREQLAAHADWRPLPALLSIGTRSEQAPC